MNNLNSKNYNKSRINNHLQYWLENPSSSLDYLSHGLPMDESIIQVISLNKMPLKDHHHWSSFLPPFHVVEEHFTSTVSSDIFTKMVFVILHKLPSVLTPRMRFGDWGFVTISDKTTYMNFSYTIRQGGRKEDLW